MRPSSSPSDTGEPGLFDEVLARGAVRAAVSDAAWLQAMLDVEGALAEAQADVGLIPSAAARAVVDACQFERYEVAALASAAAGPGNPVLPLVEALRAQVAKTSTEAADAVHKGATSQDILDTAAMLVAHRALARMLDDLTAAADAAARLAREHRETAVAGRTLLQYALPTTFGLKAAGWLVALDEATDRLAEIQRSRLAVQLGGPVGTLSGFGHEGTTLVARVAAELGLAAPLVPWHTDRTRVAELTGALATAAGVVGKIARDVVLLAQSEVGEVAEAAPGASTAMAHKRNPVASVAAQACAMQAPGLAAILYAAMAQEHERGAGGWHAEWRPLRELLIATGSAAAWLRECLTGLTIDEKAMAANLARLAGVAGVADPAAGVGAATELVDRALAAHGARQHETARRRGGELT